MCTGVAPQTSRHYVGQLDGAIVTKQPQLDVFCHRFELNRNTA